MEAHVPPMATGPLEAHVLPAEARVPPKPFRPQAIPPSKLQAGPLPQPEALSHLFWPQMLSDLSTMSLITHTRHIAKMTSRIL